MAPRQVSHQSIPWRDAHPFFLLSPLMGLLSWAWSRLRGPGAPEPWLVETITSADQGEAKPSLAVHYAQWGRHPQVAATEENGEASWGACPDLKANNPFLEAWGLPADDDDTDEDYSREEATSVPREQGSDYIDGQPAFLSPSLLRITLQGFPGEEEFEEGIAEDKKTTFLSFPPSHWGYCPGVKGEKEEEDDREAVNKEAPRTSTSPLCPGPKPRAWAYCAGEEEARTKEEERTENKEARMPSISLSSAGFHPSTWECCSGEESEKEEDRKAEKGEADPGPHSILAQRPRFRTWEHQPSKITEEEDEDDEDNVSGEAEGLSSDSYTSTFLRVWVYRPGEDTEEEDEDSDSGSAEEEDEAEGPSSIPRTNAFLRAWVYQPGEDTEEEEEDSDSGAAEEEEAEGPSSVPPTSTFLKAWVYRPGEDTEEEEEENEEEKDESEAADSGPSSFLQAQSALLRGWTYPSGEETEGGKAAEEWEEAEPHPFRVTIYLPGERPPPPWAPPRLPLRLQRRLQSLKSAETPTQHQDPETPQKTRKVRFSEKVTIHFLAVWAGPAQAARRGPWEQLARDRSRFARRIAQAQEKLGPCLTPAARARAWIRLGNPSPSLAAISTPTWTLPTSTAQAMPLSHAVASSSPVYVSVSLPGLQREA